MHDHGYLTVAVKVVLGESANTAVGGVDYGPGDTVEVAEDTAERWVEAGIAELAPAGGDDVAPVKRGPGRPRKES